MIIGAVDIETTSLEPDEGRIRSVQVASPDEETAFVDLDDYPDPGGLFENMSTLKLAAHNANFEERWVREKYGVDLDLHDTMVMSRVLYGGTENARMLRHGLADVVERELEEPISKEEQTSDWSGELTEAQKEYAKRDAQVLVRLFPALKERLDDERLWDVYRLENRTRRAVDAMERRGVAVHVEALDELIAEFTDTAQRLKWELEREWGINPGSGKQLAEHFALDARKGWPKTPGGAPKTNQDAMKRLVDEEPSVQKWVEWKEAEKIRSTYGESIRKRLDPDGRLRARFNAFGTATGRFSSSNPNLQNIPKRDKRGAQMRGLFWSGADDRVLVKADYASIELWLAAILWNDPAMQAALREGTNMHVRTAAAIFNVPVGEVTKEQKATGKIVNFALLYGGSPNRILEEFKKRGIPIDENGAQEMHAKFYATYKGFAKRKGIAWSIYDEALKHGDTVVARTPIGRMRSFAAWYGPLLNHEIQGTGADGIKFALARMHEDPIKDVYPVLTVHDEIVVEAPADIGRNLVPAWIEECMVEGMLDAMKLDRDEVPSLPMVEIETGREWS